MQESEAGRWRGGRRSRASLALGYSSKPQLTVTPPPPASPLPQRVAYFHSERCAQLADVALASACPERSALGHALVAAYVPELAHTSYPPATVDQLRRYHTDSYIQALADPGEQSGEELEAAGLAYDCSPFSDCLLYARLVAGGSLAAAHALRAGACDVAIHWDGGRHHAQRDKASGFCYVNDVVLAVPRLRARRDAGGERSFRRVMVVDVDIHHCDAVADAFAATDAVLVISAHKHQRGFFPGTGSPGDTGTGRGRGHTLNLALGDGLSDATFVPLMSSLISQAAAIYAPDCTVLTCGCDGLAGDPLGGWCLTPNALAEVALLCAAGCPARPLLVLGGGGYDVANTARAWAVVTAALTGARDSKDALLHGIQVPDHDHLLRYGPTFAMWDATQAAHLVPDANAQAEALARLQEDVAALVAALAAEYEA